MANTFQKDALGDYIDKDPNAVLDYLVPWTDWLEGDTIASATWIADTGITVASPSVNASPLTIDGVTYPANSVALAWLSGGSAGMTYRVTVRITTAAGRTDDRSFRLICKNR